MTGKSYEVPADMTYEQWYDLYIVKETEKEINEKIIGLKTSNGIGIESVSKHAIEQKIMRKVFIEDVIDALNNPLKIGKVKIDDQGRKSQRFVGSKVTVNVNPDSGVIATLWRTGTSTRRKFGVNKSAN